MQPRILKRTAVPARKGRKGHLYRADPIPPPPTPEEEVRITFRRHQKAERDERMDLTRALTPPKTYMGGFTRPKDIRTTYWFPGGPYILKGKTYETPPEAAYVPHTVFLLESRYRVRHGIGRVDAQVHIQGVCRAVDFVKLMDKYNSPRCPWDAVQSMDNACWPFIQKSGKVLKPTKWWGHDEKLEDIMKEIYEDENYDMEAVNLALRESVEEEVEEVEPKNQKKKRPRGVASKDVLGDPEMVRKLYHPHLRTERFWRPLLAVTASTRPLALSLARLATAHERGVPYYAAMSNDDRKCLISYSARMRNFRIRRFLHLTRDMARRLAGDMGGFIGIRFSTRERGRGISGEGLADPIPADKRTLKVLVGDWYSRAEEVFESFEQDGLDYGGLDAVQVAYMNERGRRLDADGNEVPLTEVEMSADDVQLTEDPEEEDADEDEDEEEDEVEEDKHVDEEKELILHPRDPERTRKLKPVLRGDDEAAVALRRKLALHISQRHRYVQRL